MKLKFEKKEFDSNILKLMTGTTISQAIPILVSPILTRIYTPEDFGLFAVFFAVTVIIGGIVSGKYEYAIVLPKKDEDAINIFSLGFAINLVLSMILFLIIIILDDYIIIFFDDPQIRKWLYLIPFSVFFIGLFNLLTYYNNRKKYFKDIATALIIKSLVLVTVQLFFGLLNIASMGLILGEMFSRFFSNLKLFKNIIKDKALISSISLVKMIALARKYKNFPILNLPSSLSNTLASYFPLLVIPKIFAFSVSGQFMLAKSLISIPSSLIARAFSQVLFQRISENRALKVKNLPIIIYTIKKLILIAFPITLLIYVLSPIVFSFIFGKEWELAGEIAQYLSIVFFITFITSTISVVLISYDELKLLAKWQISYLFTTSIYFLLLFLFPIEFHEFLLYYILHEVIMYLIYFYLIINTVLVYDKIEGKND